MIGWSLENLHKVEAVLMHSKPLCNYGARRGPIYVKSLKRLQAHVLKEGEVLSRNSGVLDFIAALNYGLEYQATSVMYENDPWILKAQNIIEVKDWGVEARGYDISMLFSPNRGSCL